jgi:hypothetical protein
MSCFIDGQKYSFHHNVIITNHSSFKAYWDKIKDHLSNHYQYSSFDGVEAISKFEIKVWNLDLKKNDKIKR